MSKIIGAPLYAPAPAGGGSGPVVPKFTYDGDYVIRDDGVVELLTSGTIVFLEPKVIDVFMVGGGGGGGFFDYSTYGNGAGGGGGGYTRTIRRLNIAAGSYAVTIGAGGLASGINITDYEGHRNNGGASSFNLIAVNGGIGGFVVAKGVTSNTFVEGGNGGSGGGGGVTANSDYGSGGSNGGNGETGYRDSALAGGTGQGFTTREFGETSGKLYAGGGGGGRYISATTPVVSIGGAGGGGTGSWVGGKNKVQAAAAGVANTGGGGGGGATEYGSSGTAVEGASGGSGIVCFRAAQELPELAGTWVLNERLYAPESQISYVGSFTYNNGSKWTQMVVDTSYLSNYINAQAYRDYNFSTNVWRTKGRTLIFPAGATASDEFRAWLASNATKQTD